MALAADVCIRGAGIVGRTLALLLARERLRVALVAAPPRADTAPDVRAYALNPAARTLLDGLRCWPDDRAATPVLGMQVHGDSTGLVRFDAATQGVPALNWIVDVPTLERQLAERAYWRSFGDLRLLRRYERARQGDWLRMSLATDGLQLLFGQPEAAAASLRRFQVRRFR